MSEDETRMKTLWTQTLFDDLYGALKKGKSDAEITKLLADLKAKDMPPAYIVKKVGDDVDAAAAKRVKAVLEGKSTPAIRASATSRKSSGGFMASLKGLFK